MADQRITQLTALAKANVAATDVLPIADVSASQTKKVTAKDLVDAGLDLVDSSSIDLAKLDQSSATKLGAAALASGAVTAAKLAADSTIAVDTTAPTTDNFEGRGYYNSSTGVLQVYSGGAFANVAASVGTGAVGTAQLADGAVTTAKASNLGTAAIADDAITYAKLQNTSGTDVLLGRSSAGAGNVEEITCTAAGRALINDADAAAQRTTLGLGTISVQSAGSVTITGGTATLSSLTSSVSSLGSVTITGGTITGITDLAVADGGTGASTAADARTNLGLAIGTNVLAYDAGLASIASLATAADQFLYTTATDTFATGSITAAGRALLDDANAAAQRATLGLGTLATQNGTFSGTFSGTSSGTNTGDQTITLTGDVTGSGTGTFAATIADGAITTAKVASNAVTTAKIADDAVTAAKLADGSAVIVTSATPTGSGNFTGQQWLNTATGVEYTWTGTSWQRQAAINALSFTETTPLAFSVSYPDNFSASVSISLDTQAANRVWAGPTTGVDATPTFRALVPGDLPDATASTKGIIQPGTGLSVSSGTLNHSNSTTAGTYTKLTVDAQGHVTLGATLTNSDIPALDASKITTGTFGTSVIADDAITGVKLADYATAKIGDTIPTADYVGQLYFNPLDKNIYLWDSNVWQPVGVSLGELIFAGTYDATLNEVASTTSVGAAAGLVVGDPLPAASSTFTSYYLVVSEGGTGVSPAPTVTLAPPDLLLCNGTAWQEIDVSSTYAAQSAANVAFSATGTIGSTNVQLAIEEVASEAANASNLTSGTVGVARGGTGNTTYAKGDLLVASAATTLNKLTAGTNGQVLRANSATATGLEWGADYLGTVTNVTGSGAISVANGTTTPAISVASASTSVAGVVQLSDSTSTTSSSLAATSTAVKAAYDLAAAALPAAGGTLTGNLNLDTGFGVVFEGTTADAFETTLLAAGPAADRTVYLPDADGTLVLSGSIVNADINASAAIADTKLATISTAGKVNGTALTGTIPSAVLGNSSLFVGTTSVALNRASANLGLTGISSLAMPGATSGTITVTPAATAGTTAITIPATSGTLITTGDTGSVTNTMLAGSIAYSKLSLSGSIVNADINASAAIADTKLATISTAGKVSGTAITSGNISTSGSFATTSTLAVGQSSAAANTDFDLAGTYAQTVVAVGALNIDCSTGNYFTKTINGASTFTVSNVPASRSYAFTLELTHTSGAITWFSGVVWPGGTAPTLTTGKVHLFMFVTDDGGTTWRASSLINY